MNLIYLKEQIVHEKINNLYYFTGEDWKIRQTYIQQIAKISHSKLQYVSNIKDIIKNIKTTSVISRPNCYVVYEDKDYLTNEHAWKTIKDLINNDIVIFVYNSIDKRSKFYKHFKDTLVEFNHMSSELLFKYINQVISLNSQNSQRLINACEQDLGRIMLEVDKIKHYLPTDYNKSCEILFNKDLIYTPPKDAVFELVDAILKRNTQQVFYLYDQCKKVGENNLVILSNLFNNTRATYQVQTYRGTEDLCKITGLKSGTIWGCKQRLGYYTNNDLVYIMKLVQYIEQGIKTGTIDDDISIDYLLAKLFY